MPVQKIVTIREGDEIPQGWWFVKMLAMENRPAGIGTTTEKWITVLIGSKRESAA